MSEPDCCSDDELLDSQDEAEQEGEQEEDGEDEYLSDDDGSTGMQSIHNGVSEENSSTAPAGGWCVLDVPEMKRMQVRLQHEHLLKTTRDELRMLMSVSQTTLPCPFIDLQEADP